MKEKSVYDEMMAAGLVTGTHESDLYVKHCPEAKAIATRHGKTGALLTTFKNQVTGELNYELPFCFDPFWNNKGTMAGVWSCFESDYAQFPNEEEHIHTASKNEVAQ